MIRRRIMLPLDSGAMGICAVVQWHVTSRVTYRYVIDEQRSINRRSVV